jgi:hypothetical protein
MSDAAKIGEMGAQLVLKDSDAKADNKLPTIFTIKPKLIVRGSTGPAKTRNGAVFPDHAEPPKGDRLPVAGEES